MVFCKMGRTDNEDNVRHLSEYNRETVLQSCSLTPEQVFTVFGSVQGQIFFFFLDLIQRTKN